MFVILEWLSMSDAVAHDTIYREASFAQDVADRFSEEAEAAGAPVEFTVYELREVGEC